ncbi:hypothetical protein LPW11_18705 [Geomonas sp. RF6]|uniref:hypothetical protein n=1 Tax=Geomonas sp. RF6 TaxID=2897342 RepID=UPI001E626897|nr:hypothetical protein [Geomonas sp. RF6]UFS69905.1 hypothetical protein LPW11_18705 [Geomonas sp. RF6]
MEEKSVQKKSQLAGGDSAAGWQWCGQCERASKGGAGYSCGYDDCEGYIGNIWTWEYVRKQHPHLPEVPEYDVIYSIKGA